MLIDFFLKVSHKIVILFLTNVYTTVTGVYPKEARDSWGQLAGCWEGEQLPIKRLSLVNFQKLKSLTFSF